MAKVQLLHKIQSVLVLDDNELTRESLKFMYEQSGAKVFTTGALDKALSILEGLMAKKATPDLIYTDLKISGCYGLQVLQSIKDIVGDANIPIIVSSRGFNELAIMRMKLYGVLGYVEKPVFTEDLFNFSLELLAQYQGTLPTPLKIVA